MNEQKRFIRVKDACTRYEVSRNTLMKYAEQANALSRVGNIVYVDSLALDEHIYSCNKTNTKGNALPKANFNELDVTAFEFFYNSGVIDGMSGTGSFKAVLGEWVSPGGAS